MIQETAASSLSESLAYRVAPIAFYAAAELVKSSIPCGGPLTVGRTTMRQPIAVLVYLGGPVHHARVRTKAHSAGRRQHN